MSKSIFFIFRELKFPKFVKDKELIQLLKGMLTKNQMKRILKLSQIKSSDYFKDFGWDALVSFNLDPCYNIQLQPDNVSKDITPYNDYLKEKLVDFKFPKDFNIDYEYRAKVDEWFEKF